MGAIEFENFVSEQMNDPNRKAQILAVDDHPIVRQGLAQLINLQADLHLCCEAADAEQAMSSLLNCQHDIAIVDISLPGISGFDLLKAIKNLNSAIPVLIMSMYDESTYAERAFKAGARGYIMKQEATSNVLTAIRQLIRGGVYLSPSLQSRLLGKLDLTSTDNKAPGSLVGNLSEREFQVLRLIGLGHGTSEIAGKLNRSVKTIETHRANIKVKLGISTSCQLVKFAVQWATKAI